MRKLMTAVLLGGTAMMAVPAFAQDKPADANANAGNGDIIVTARRQNENLERVPAAITAFSGAMLEARSLRSDSDLQSATPGLTIRQTQGNNSLTYSIRGQTADTFSGTPSAVIAYLNEVPLTIASASSFYDLESVQVLKGPQGTLFGRNATGGGVLFTSAKPTDKLEAKVTGRFGNLALREGEGMVNLPLGDKAALRVAFDVMRKDGYIHNNFNGQTLGNQERNSVRASLRLAPVDGVTNTTVFQYEGVDGTNTGASYVWSIYGCGKYNGFTLNCNSSFLIPYVAAQKAAGLYVTNHPGDARHHGFSWQASNTTSYAVSDTLTVKNILGASRARVNSVQPQLGAPYVTIATYDQKTGNTGNNLEVKTISEELQLQGKALDGRLNYTTGVYFQWQTTNTIWPQTYFLNPPYPPVFGTCTAGACVTSAFQTKDRTAALYAQATYALTDALKLTGGVRYTWDKIDFAQLNVADNPFYGAFPNEGRTFSDPSWEVGLEYQATPELFAYVKTRGSFRAGGYNGAAVPLNIPAVQGGNQFNAEHTQDIEGGVKFRGEIAGVRTTINVDAFNQWVQDVQRVEFPPPAAVTVNVPSQVVSGIEGEASFKLFDNLELGWQGAYVNARYTNGNVTIKGVPYLYGPVADTPKWSGTLWMQSSIPVPAALGEISVRMDLYGQTGQYFSNASSSLVPKTFLPGYSLLNERISWNHVMQSGLSLAVFSRNLGNRGYFVGGMPLGSALGHNAAAVGEPRTYGVEASYKF
ncbi:MAG: TonB-dependent receptor [Sphingomonadales bacterium]|nr:TonB-dependent receptor [Sphingomonadales bacterium]